MCLNLGVTVLASTTEIQLVLSSQCTICSPKWSAKDSMYLLITFLLYSFVHASDFSFSGLRCNSWLNMYFPVDRNTNQIMYNTQNISSSVYNDGIFCIWMTFQTIMGCVVFNLIPIPCKPDEI